MTERRWRSCTMLYSTAILILVGVGLSAGSVAKEVNNDSAATPTDAVEESKSVSASSDAGRDRRQVYPPAQFYRPYDPLPPRPPQPYPSHAPRLYNVAPQQARPQRPRPYLARPQRPRPQLARHYDGRFPPHVTGGKPSSSWRPILTKAPLRSSQALYTPSRTPAVTHPFLGPASSRQVTPVPHHLRPLQPQPPTLAYGAPPPYPGPGECPDGLQCVPLVTCASSYREIENQPQLSCSIYGGAVGVCCPEQPNKINLHQLFSEVEIQVPDLTIKSEVIDEAVRAGLSDLEDRNALERELRERDIRVTEAQDPAFSHLQFFKTSPLALNLSRNAYVLTRAADHLMSKYGLNPLEAGFGLQQLEMSNTIISENCRPDPVCTERDMFYRSVDGSCNNLEHPSWGQARTGFQRILPPHYSDGLFRPRESVGGGPLPSPRLVSSSIVGDMDRPSHDLTLSVMQWGQFVNHDLAHTPINRLGNMSGIQCCSPDGRGVLDASLLHPSCLPIDIPADDPFFARFGLRCMNFVRSMFAPRTSPCILGFAKQMNQISHYLDGSNIYGSSEQNSQQVRQFKGGLLRMQERDLLPADPNIVACVSLKEGLPCFMAGDNRVNQHADLIAIHTVWMRMHNRVARELARLNPHWSDETIYQETRRIVVAIYQHIIYNEWLPLVLGKDYMAENGILPRREGFSRDYDVNINAAIWNEFATVAYRFGHSIVQGLVDFVNKKGETEDSEPMYETFNNPSHIYTPGKLDQFLRGLATQPMQKVDNYVTTSLTNRLFQTPQVPFGLDLVSFNVQRGRDHGIAPYNELRVACGLPRARTFEDLLDVIPQKVVQALQRLYSSVDDIDPFVAVISEKHIRGSILGPTVRCLVGEQFIRLKRGDRFFYDLADMPSSFSQAQLNSIRLMSWARVLCETGDMLGYVQPLAFLRPRGLNERIPCDSPGIPGLDLSPWTSRAD
nr:peroxidase-like [Procambarus clarkii]